ncbi:MAG: penicillin acylase family protein, partial [Myxococcales bacterium]
SRMCHQQVTDRLAGTDGFPGTNVTVDIVKQMVLGGRVYSAEKFRQQVLDGICTEASLPLGSDLYLGTTLSGTVDIGPACTAIRNWDGRNNPASVGSLAWDEFWFRLDVLANDSSVRPFATRFDPADPLETPRDLDTTKAYVRQAFAAGVYAVQQAGFDFTLPRSAISYRLGADGAKIPVLGGYQRTGNFTIGQVRSPVLKAGEAWGPVNYGNSYMQVIGFLPEGKVDANTFVTYSQSEDPASPHFDDYSRLYSRKEWLKAAFTEAEIAAQVLPGTDIQLRD